MTQTKAKPAPLVLADQGFFWTGLVRQQTPNGTIAAGQMFVQYQIPEHIRHPYPIVMVHGGGGQGTDFLGTPDGRPGWATYFLKQVTRSMSSIAPGTVAHPCIRRLWVP